MHESLRQNRRKARSLLQVITLLIMSAGVWAGDANLDRQLIDSLADKDLEAARQALEAGANPQARLGSRLDDSALCTAIDDRGTDYLELLLDYGASPDFNSHDGLYSLRTPLACAIYLYNPAAFDLLLARGANPDADLCSECAPRFRHSALTQAMVSSKFPMALTLVRNSEVDELEMDAIVILLEGRPFSESHPWNDERDALIDWVREQGVAFDPKPANPPVPGYSTRCVFSVRDDIEGLSEGTICD